MDFGYNNSTLFPEIQSSPTLSNNSSTDGGELLWNNINTFAIPDDNTTASQGFSSSLRIQGSNQQVEQEKVNPTTTKEESGVFNISWGGNDKPPTDIHPEKEEEQPIKLSRPLPKPRGIRKLPEPEPAPDGTIDEDTLKRRKNTDAARRSRMKKFLKVDQLESQVSTLQAENAKLVLSNALLESDKKSMLAKEKEYQKRIKYLEDLMKTHGWESPHFL